MCDICDVFFMYKYVVCRCSCQIYSLHSCASENSSVLHPSSHIHTTQASFYQLAREFADKEMLPHAQEWDETSTFPLKTFEKFAELGFAGVCCVCCLCPVCALCPMSYA